MATHAATARWLHSSNGQVKLRASNRCKITMTNKTLTRRATAFLLAALMFSGHLPQVAMAAQLQAGDTVAVCGDSITEQRMYSVFIEDYLLMCQPVPDLKAHQFGWSGEKADGFLNRMRAEVLPFGPTVATTCYGMKDGARSGTFSR